MRHLVMICRRSLDPCLVMCMWLGDPFLREHNCGQRIADWKGNLEFQLSSTGGINERLKNNQKIKNSPYYYLGWLLESANLLRKEGSTKVASPRITTAIIWSVNEGTLSPP